MDFAVINSLTLMKWVRQHTPFQPRDAHGHYCGECGGSCWAPELILILQQDNAGAADTFLEHFTRLRILL